MNINMEHKNIVATIYLKDGKAIKARDNYEEYPDVIELAKLYNDSGIDKIMIFDRPQQMKSMSATYRLSSISTVILKSKSVQAVTLTVWRTLRSSSMPDVFK